MFYVTIRINRPKNDENISGIYNISWDIVELPGIFYGYIGYIGNYTTLYYSLDNGITWDLIVNISEGNYGHYNYSWDTSNLPNTDNCQLKIQLVSTRFSKPKSKELIVKDLTIFNAS